MRGKLIGESILTEGNLKNDHFYLTPFLDRFPADLLGGTNNSSLAPKLAYVDWGDTSPVETDIASDKKMFRRRGWVRQFFHKYDAKPGDTVSINETAPFHYVVSIRKADKS